MIYDLRYSGTSGTTMSGMTSGAVGVVVVLLLLLSGDVETNPGPVGEVLCLTV